MINFAKSTVLELQNYESKAIANLADSAEKVAMWQVELENVKSELSKRLKPANEPRVSDHAMMRYMERVMGLDIEKIRSEILTDNAKAALKMGATKYTVNGVKFKAKNGVFVTVI